MSRSTVETAMSEMQFTARHCLQSLYRPRDQAADKPVRLKSVAKSVGPQKAMR